MEEVILVDIDDREIGTAEKMMAHKNGILHRAFSVFLFQGDRLLLQKRAASKYHCGGLWTNTCCSHPRPGETVKEAAIRRLKEEMGIETEQLQIIDTILYRYPFENGLTEFEYDYLLAGEYVGPWEANPEEVDDVKWINIEDLKVDVSLHPEAYTPWFIIAFNDVLRITQR